MNVARSVAVFAILCTAVASARAQEEIGKKDRQKIEIEWAEYKDGKSYAIEYEKVIPRSTVKRVAEELEDALAQYVLVFKFKPQGKLKVRFLDSPNTYEQEGGKPSTAGHFLPGTGYLVLKQLEFHELIPTTYHEAFHQYLHYYIGEGVAIPTWFNEGMASYYEVMQRQKGTKKLDYKLIDNRKLRMIQDKLLTRSAVPLEKLINTSYQDFHDKTDNQKESLNYTQSFSVIYFLMQGMGGKPVFQFTEELKKTKDPEAATEKIFGKDLKKLKSVESQWKSYVAQVKIAEPPK